MTRFPNQVDDRPVIFALLQMIQGEFGQQHDDTAHTRVESRESLDPACPLPSRHSEAAKVCGPVRRLTSSRDVPPAFGSLDTPDSSSQFRTKKSRVGCLICQTSYGG